jgi:hypothetical protein
LVLAVSGCLRKENAPEFSGRIYVSGNEPFTRVMLELSNGSTYCVVGPLEGKLRGRQGETVVVRGEFVDAFCPSRTGKAINITGYK